MDSGYSGEIHAIISNVSSRTQAIKKGARVRQLMITSVVIADFVSGLGEESGTLFWGCAASVIKTVLKCRDGPRPPG